MVSSRSVVAILVLVYTVIVQCANTTTLTVFLPVDGRLSYAASVVKADCTRTVMAIACTTGYYSNKFQRGLCKPEKTALVTYANPTEFAMIETTRQPERLVSASNSMRCTRIDSYLADCDVRIRVNSDGITTGFHRHVHASTLTNIGMTVLPITAGADLLPARPRCAIK